MNFVSIYFVSFRFVSIYFVSFRFVSFRFDFVSHFTGTRVTVGVSCNKEMILFLSIRSAVVVVIAW